MVYYSSIVKGKYLSSKKHHDLGNYQRNSCNEYSNQGVGGEAPNTWFS